MRRLLTVVLGILLAAATAAPAGAVFFPGDPIDGPGGEVRALGDVDLARDGTGALVYVRVIDGVDHVVISRFEGGVLQPLERLDAALPGRSSQPVLGAADNGRLVVVFVNDGVVYGVVRVAAGQGFSAPVPLGLGVDPAVDLSINGTAFASFTSAGDVRIARLDRRTNAWTGIPQPADVDPTRDAGVGSGRSRVTISADGIGVVTWGESGHVFARKMFNEGISTAPQDLTPPTFDNRVSTISELPEIDSEDDSSYAWVVFRQSFADGGSRVLARRQRGTEFDPPVAVDVGDESTRDPRIDLNGRGLGLATMAGVTSGQPMTALLDRRDTFGAQARILAPSTGVSVAVPSISENNSAVVAAVIAGAGVPPLVAVRPYLDGKAEPDVTLSRPELGPVAAQLGFDAASDRAGGVLVAWVQGGPADRRLVAGYFDRPPATFSGYTTQRCCRRVSPVLKWQPAFNLWGPLIYEVFVDGVLVGRSSTPELKVVTPLKTGMRRWQVRAIDVRGQATRSKTRLLRVDGAAPLLTVHHRRKRRVVTLSVRARDDTRRGRLAAGLEGVSISWGDGSTTRAGTRLRTTHRYGRGRFTLTVTARDGAGNETVNERRLRIGV